ncbi:MAG TPA: sugar phosphate nucleotidyltransferase [candidate division Zixibacteria bacterium]|nr:sugar phosphate nucleotidyltransferase [candidate division Zixibacteria bacterium]MDM7974052.1 sugar phosphate nucleotidyltransferase [candidate division Zixibacteria bacterium]HOD65534.1 sugar phosphate nucleotidyltransferase [candidate division Zixibacteria bacterium]HPI32905.1 sugar phosphate nucleotidyltransferase [candidate division Zixibacteria bacterium]HPM36972.1 sugar phosphate nucleotidyltransferase [candidate division Zixibacteria bacterium]
MSESVDIEAIILAGGQGTRLYPHTAEIPKPLVTVGDRPIIEILIHTLRRRGIRRLRLAVSHLAHLIEAALGDGRGLGVEITYSREPRPLSTIGPLTLMEDLPEHFLVVNGDILTDLDFRRLYEGHRERGVVATVATCRRENRVDYGVIETDAQGRLAAFHEKPARTVTVSAGVYVFSREILRYVPRGERFGFDDLMATLLARGEPVATYPIAGYWLDVGRLEDYAVANQEFDRIKALLLSDPG